jgi:hypothetical protein
MDEVEIFWPAGLPADGLLEAERALLEAGIDTTSRLRPAVRGAELSVLVLLTGSVLEPFLKGLFERVGVVAHAALADFVRHLLRRQEHRPVPAPASVVVEISATGDQLVFTPNLPEEAFRQAIALEPGPAPGRWVWDHHDRRWSCFEQR